MTGSKPIEILTVEDNPRDAALTLRALRTHGLANSVFHVSDGQQALEIAQAGYYWLVVNQRPPA